MRSVDARGFVGTHCATVSDEKNAPKPETSDEDRIFVLEDDDGKERDYALLAIVTFEGHDYALLAPADDDGTSERVEISVYRYGEEGEDVVFEEIEDEDLYERVVAFCEEALAQQREADESVPGKTSS